MTEIGKKAPTFTLPRDGGETVSLSDFKGKNLVIFFYPRDNTSGCTTEAIGFTAKLPEFEAAGTAVIGVSKDSVKSHEKFRDKQALKMPLLSDAEGEMCEDFGVWKDKKLYGKTYKGIERSTFLIDGEGIIRQVWRKVRVPGHVEDVLTAAQEL
jgi:peroxiredoxin Q/BCP